MFRSANLKKRGWRKMIVSDQFEVSGPWGPKSVWLVSADDFRTAEVVAYIETLVGDGNLREDFAQELDEAYLLAEKQPFRQCGREGCFVAPSTIVVVGSDEEVPVASDEFGEIRLVWATEPTIVVHRSHSGDTALTFQRRYLTGSFGDWVPEDSCFWTCSGKVSEQGALGLPERVRSELPGYVEEPVLAEDYDE